MPLPSLGVVCPTSIVLLHPHYRTFIPMPAELEIDCGSPCETVTISYLNANQYLMIRACMPKLVCQACPQTRFIVDQDPARILCRPPASRGSYLWPMPARS